MVILSHEPIREILRKLLQEEFGFDLVSECGWNEDVLDQIRQLDPDLVVLELEVTGLSGLEAIRRVAEKIQRPRLLVISSQSDDVTMSRVEKAHACGFIHQRECNLVLLRTAITAVALGGTFYSTSYQAAKSRRVNDPWSFEKLLSEREQEILALVGEFKSNVEIAAILKISHNTAQTHRKHLMQKLQCRSTTQLIKYSQEHGFPNLVPLLIRKLG